MGLRRREMVNVNYKCVRENENPAWLSGETRAPHLIGTRFVLQDIPNLKML